MFHRTVHRPSPLRWFVSLCVLALALSASSVSHASDDREQQDLVDQARMTLDNFLADSTMSWFHEHVKEAKGLLIVPQYLKAAFFVGGAGGSGVLVGRDDQTGTWSDPAFFTMGAGSFGFQWGAQASEVVLLIMTQRGVDSLLAGNFKLGADGSVAIGPVGMGVAGATTTNLGADLLSFVRAKGLFAGVSLEGAVIAPRNEWNAAYYGKAVSPSDIVVRRDVTNPHAEGLRTAIVRSMDKP